MTRAISIRLFFAILLVPDVYAVTKSPLGKRADVNQCSLSVANLRDTLAALSNRTDRSEAARLATSAHNIALELANEYRIGAPPLLHNLLIHLHIKKRGLCGHWTHDLLARLDKLHLKTLELHWGVAGQNTWREHNCVVVTANHQPFYRGVILDGWRHGGRLYWCKVSADHYPWRELF